MYLVMHVNLVFCSCDLDLDPMTLTYELGLGIVKTYLHTKNEAFRSRLSEVRARTGQTHRQTDRHTHRLTDATKSIYHAAFAGGQ